MIKITEDKMKSGIIKAVNQFKRDCDYILNNTKSVSNGAKANLLDQNKESAIGKISILLWLCEYDNEIRDLGNTGYDNINSMYHQAFDEIMYKERSYK